MSKSRFVLIPGCFYWVNRRGDEKPVIGQVCYGTPTNGVWMVVGDKQEVEQSEIEVVAGPLPSPDNAIPVKRTLGSVAVSEAIGYTMTMLGKLTQREREAAERSAWCAVRWTRRLLAEELAEAAKNDIGTTQG